MKDNVTIFNGFTERQIKVLFVVKGDAIIPMRRKQHSVTRMYVYNERVFEYNSKYEPS